MPTPRKPHPTYITRDDAEAMIAEAIAVERERNQQALAAAQPRSSSVTNPLGIRTSPTFRQK